MNKENCALKLVDEITIMRVNPINTVSTGEQAHHTALRDVSLTGLV